jgi:hypothetical protein
MLMVEDSGVIDCRYVATVFLEKCNETQRQFCVLRGRHVVIESTDGCENGAIESVGP